jgi:cytoskeletal protein CcmA (bactofilin family)
VKANIRAQLIIVEGTVDGDLTAEKSVLVKETAKVCGNIFAPSVSIQEGANFSGSIDMDGKKAAQQLGKNDTVRLAKFAGGAT